MECSTNPGPTHGRRITPGVKSIGGRRSLTASAFCVGRALWPLVRPLVDRDKGFNLGGQEIEAQALQGGGYHDQHRVSSSPCSRTPTTRGLRAAASGGKLSRFPNVVRDQFSDRGD